MRKVIHERAKKLATKRRVKDHERQKQERMEANNAKADEDAE